jgi:hypothetical protein
VGPKRDTHRAEALAQVFAVALDFPAVDDERGRFDGGEARGQ